MLKMKKAEDKGQGDTSKMTEIMIVPPNLIAALKLASFKTKKSQCGGGTMIFLRMNQGKLSVTDS